MKPHIPNILTLCNLACGTLSLFWMMEGKPLYYASLLIIIAALFDLLDGLAARALKVTSAIGKDLDSLADLVSFAVVPSLIVFDMMGSVEAGLFASPYIKYVAIIIALLSALRLARFNNDVRQKNDFIGLPTPAHALFWISWPLILREQHNYDLMAGVWSVPVSQASFLIFLVVLPLLLNSGLKLFALKFQSGGWAANQQRYTFLLLGAAVLALCAIGAGIISLALPLLLLLYLVISVIFNHIINPQHEI